MINRRSSRPSTSLRNRFPAQPADPTVSLEDDLSHLRPTPRGVQTIRRGSVHSSSLPRSSTTVDVLTDYTREDWTEEGYRIAGPRPDWHLVHRRIAHHSGAVVIPADRGQWLRNLQRDWEDNRDPGYSLGYLYLACQSGDTWEIRGNSFRSAANKGWEPMTGVENVNPYTAPILFDVTPGEKATPAAINAALRLWRDKIQPHATQWLEPVEGHNALDRTACPGTGITWQIAHGEFLEAQPPQPEDPNMADAIANATQFAYHTGLDGSFVLAGGRWTVYYGAVPDGVPVVRGDWPPLAWSILGDMHPGLELEYWRGRYEQYLET